ncbi:MAG: TonB-dependent receptor [Acidobacteria bacterium]|nr:TonB-dependent receptor [Acidobacteriota bacterium]
MISGWNARVGALGLFALLSARAQVPTLRELMGTKVVSASKQLQDPLLAPAKVVVITEEDIRSRGYLDLEEILHDYAGFDFEKGMGVHWSQIYMRGLRSTNSDRFLFIWDGVIQNDIQAQVTWFERQFPLVCIDRIEILYGPSSLLYGANAFSGIINVILKPAALRQGEVRVHSGPWATRIAEFSFGREVGGWALSLAGKVLRSDEWDWSGESWTDRSGRRRPYGLDARFYNLSALAANGNVGPDGRLRVLMDGVYRPWSDKQGFPTKDRFLEAGADRGGFTFRYMHWYREESEEKWSTPQAVMNSSWIPKANALYLGHRATLGEAWEAKTYALMRTTGLDPETRESETTTVFTPGDPEDLRIQALHPFGYYRLFNREYRLGEQLSYQGSRVSAVLGGELVLASIQATYSLRHRPDEPFPTVPHSNARNLGAFANVQSDLSPTFSLAAGLRYDYNWEAGGPGGFHNLLTSRLAAILTPSSRNTFKLIHGQAFQEPPALKRYTTTPNRPYPSPDLKPERLTALEFTWIHQREDFQSTASVFLNQVEDLIQQVSIPSGSGTINKFQNVGKVEIFGCEWEGRARLPWGWDAYANLTANRARDLPLGRDTGGIAPLQSNLGTEGRVGAFGFSLRGHWVAPRRTQNHDNPSPYVVPRVPAYATLDLGLTWYDALKGLDVRLDARNLANARYFDPAPRSGDGNYYNGAILQQPARVFLGLTYRF